LCSAKVENCWRAVTGYSINVRFSAMRSGLFGHGQESPAVSFNRCVTFASAFPQTIEIKQSDMAAAVLDQTGAL
jgi:hypothetical protein